LTTKCCGTIEQEPPFFYQSGSKVGDGGLKPEPLSGTLSSTFCSYFLSKTNIVVLQEPPFLVGAGAGSRSRQEDFGSVTGSRSRQ